MKPSLLTNTIRVFIALLIVFLAGAWFYTFKSLKREIEQSQIAHNGILTFYSDSLTNLEIKVTKYGDSLSQARQIILTQDNAIELGIISKNEMDRKYLKSIQTINKLKEQITILDRPGEYVNTPEIKDSCDCLKLPLSLEFSDPWFYLKVTAREKIPTLDSLGVFSLPIITSGLQKDPGLRNIFQKAYPVVLYENSNIYVTPLDIQHVRIETVEKWYQKDAAKMGAAAFFGWTISVLLTNK